MRAHQKRPGDQAGERSGPNRQERRPAAASLDSSHPESALDLAQAVGNRGFSRMLGEETPVQRAPDTPAIQRAPGEDPDKISPAPAAPVEETINLQQVMGHEHPDYFHRLKWTKQSDNRWTAQIPKGDPIWAAVERYARLSQDRAPMTAPTQEKTRMEVAKTQSVNPDLTDEQRAAHLARTQEGKKNGPPPPKSAHMAIESITALANHDLWEKYQANRQIFRQSMVTPGPVGGDLEASGKDRSEKIPWTTGSRPNLDGAAKLGKPGPYERSPTLQPTIPDDAGEAFLFHGTSSNILDMIDEGGFKPGLSKNKGTDDKPRYGPLGQGTYMADNSSKPQLYSSCPTCHKQDCEDPAHDPREMMLARTLVGHPDFAHLSAAGIGHSRRGEDVKKMKEGRMSVMSPGLKKNPERLGASGTNEIAVKDGALLYPELRIRYRPTHA